MLIDDVRGACQLQTERRHAQPLLVVVFARYDSHQVRACLTMTSQYTSLRSFSVVELSETDTESLESVHGMFEVQMKPVVRDFAKLALDIAHIISRYQLEVFHRGHCHPPPEVETVVAVFKDRLLSLEDTTALLDLIHLYLSQESPVWVVELYWLGNWAIFFVDGRHDEL